MNDNTHNKLLMFNPRTHDLKEFESLAAMAKDAGFTHIFISDLAERTDYQGADKDSPWTEWSTVLPSIFKHATPPGLEDAYPADFVKRQMEFMKAKHRIVEKLDMRAAYQGTEPHWLNDKVYRKHPQWRGSRADNSLRTTGLHFAPNTDHPEVREAYRLAVREITKRCPRLDFFSFVTNDSGSFYPWEKRLYANVNGPTGYEGRDMGERVAGFLMALRQGAADSGVDAYFFTDVYSRFSDDEIHLVLRSLRPGIGVNGRVPGPLAEECSAGGCGDWGGGTWLPSPVIDQFPNPMGVIAGAAAIRNSPSKRLTSGGSSPVYFKALKFALSRPPVVTEKQRMDLCFDMAGELYGSDAADDVFDGWSSLARAQTMMGAADVGIMSGPVILRWLTRPLVAHQEMLTPEERAYWEPYMYQSQESQPDTYLDYLNCSGYKMCHNWTEATKTCCAIDNIEGALAGAAAKLQSAADKAHNAEAADQLRNDSYRILAMRSMTLTVRQFLQVGTLIYLRDEQNADNPKTTSTGGEGPSMPKGDLGSQGLWFMQRALRWELDNVYELIDLLKKSPVPLFYTARHPSFAGPLVLEPEILEHLERKAELILKYWRTAEDGYYRPTLGG